MNGDPGHFGPDSMMWKVNKEITVLFGGARALLMHAAHPLIAAGARQTSFYQRDPWKRLIRTLSLQNSVTFGTIEEANDSATRINRLHEVIKGKDEVTGETYDALDHEQLLWVHACLQLSSIYFYEQTVKKLTESEKNEYHIENMLAAKLVLVDVSKMPQTHKELKEWVDNQHTELADWAADAEAYTEQYKAGDLEKDEYVELMEDLKRSQKISEAADALAIRSRAVESLDNIMKFVGAVL